MITILASLKMLNTQGKQTFIHYTKRRYHYGNCNNHFNKTFSLLPKHCRITIRLVFLAINILRDSQNVKSVAKQLEISTSVIDRFHVI